MPRGYRGNFPSTSGQRGWCPWIWGLRGSDFGEAAHLWYLWWMKWRLCLCAALAAASACRHAVGEEASSDDLPVEDELADAGDEDPGQGGGVDAGSDCPTTPVDGLIITVVDTATLFKVCDAEVTADAGAGPETLRVEGEYPSCEYRGAANAAGTYTVRAEKPGYVTEELANVRVQPSGTCDGVIAVRTNLELTPAP